MLATIFSIVPVLLYSFIVYLSTTVNSIDYRKSIRYLYVGGVSALGVLGFTIVFPSFYDYYFLEINLSPGNNGPLYSATYLGQFIMAFFQVSFIEEGFKLLMLYIFAKRFLNLSSIEIIFYSMMVGGGFAIVENIVYSRRYDSLDVLLIRTFSAVFAHMICGIIMGYFISMGKQNTDFTNKTVFNFLLKTNHRYKEIIFILIGYICAVLYHGLYDFDLFISMGYHSVIIVIGLFLSYYLFNKIRKVC